MNYKELVCTIAVVLAVGPLASTSRAQTAPAPPDARARAILAMLIGINSTHEHGSTAAARAIEALLAQGKFPATDVELIEPEPAKGNLLIRYRGRGTAKPIVFLGHLDVVEARPEDWSVPPFELTERDGYFYGRGTQDVKGDIAAALAALLRLHERRYVPERDLYLALTSDEEGGGTLNGAKWLFAHRPELRSVAYVVNFDAGGGDSEHGKPVLMRLQTSEKIYATFAIETTNPGGHSSIPGPDNAIYRLAHALLRIEAHQFPLDLTATTRGYLAGLATMESEPWRSDLEAVAATGDAAAAARLSVRPEFNAFLRTTCVATEISGGHAENALPQRVRATIQCRVIPKERVQDLVATLEAVIADPSVHLAPVREIDEAPDSPMRPELSAALTAVAHSLWPGVPVVPSMDEGASDNVYPRAAGIPTYGIAGTFIDLDDVRSHGGDERVRTQDFYNAVAFYERLFRALGDGR